MSSPFDPSFWHDIVVAGVGLVGALLGAVIGALMTGRITRQLGREALEEERTQADRVGAFAVRHLLTRIYSAALSNLMHIGVARQREAAAREHETEFSPVHVSMLMEGYANTGEEVHFTTDQLVAVERLGGHDLLNKVASLDAQYNAIRTGLEMYRERRIQLTDRLTGTLEDGTQGVAVATAAEYHAVAPRLAELDAFVEQLERLNKDLYEQSFDALGILIPACGSKLNLKFKMQFNRLAGDPVVIASQPTA